MEDIRIVLIKGGQVLGARNLHDSSPSAFGGPSTVLEVPEGTSTVTPLQPRDSIEEISFRNLLDAAKQVRERYALRESAMVNCWNRWIESQVNPTNLGIAQRRVPRSSMEWIDDLMKSIQR
jgi:hypothetical protein